MTKTALDPNREFYYPEHSTGMTEYLVMYRDTTDTVIRWAPARTPNGQPMTDLAEAQAWRDNRAADSDAAGDTLVFQVFARTVSPFAAV